VWLFFTSCAPPKACFARGVTALLFVPETRCGQRATGTLPFFKDKPFGAGAVVFYFQKTRCGQRATGTLPFWRSLQNRDVFLNTINCLFMGIKYQFKGQLYYEVFALSG
jgi:hypothetical protein